MGITLSAINVRDLVIHENGCFVVQLRLKVEKKKSENVRESIYLNGSHTWSYSLSYSLLFFLLIHQNSSRNLLFHIIRQFAYFIVILPLPRLIKSVDLEF